VHRQAAGVDFAIGGESADAQDFPALDAEQDDRVVRRLQVDNAGLAQPSRT